MKAFEIKDRYDMDDYRALIHFLRGPEGCPWDREQTHESIRRNLLEEAYETAHAIDSGDVENLREELGDLLMQVLLHADMEEAAGRFTLDDVADAACKKLVFRHPHVFGDVQADSAEAVLVTWDAQKKQEKGQKTVAASMASVPENFPALWRAEKIQKKAAGAGVSTGDAPAALRKAAAALEAGTGDAGTVGEALFSLVAAARALDVDPETALHAACETFLHRFAQAETRAAAAGKGVDQVWTEVPDPSRECP